MIKKHADVIVIGGSIGGVLAAISSAKMKKKVILTEETKWIGGQFTNQGVPADEHKWIERFGCTKSYRNFRNTVRNHYRNDPDFKNAIKKNDYFNPGDGWVSRICHNPKLSLSIFNQMLEPYIKNNLIEVLTETKALSSEVEGNKIISFTVENKETKKMIQLSGKYFLDATDTGELLTLTNTEYYVGAESREDYKEPLAPEERLTQDMQPITWVAALEFEHGKSHIIPKPEEYGFFKDFITKYNKSILSWYGPSLNVESFREFDMFKWGEKDGEPILPLWSYRRIICGDFYTKAVNDVTLLNWPQNDYFLGNIIDTEDSEHHKYMARQLTLSLVYWLQTEAPRDEGGYGYPEVKLNLDALGTDDGLAMAPYIRESRRIKAKYTIKEQDISYKYNKELPSFVDSVGVGWYHIDLHSTTLTNRHVYEETWPFEIPLGSMIPERMENLIPACKNIGTTQLTNGCYRLHPIEWNIGEVAGFLASFCIIKNISPSYVYEHKLKEFQELLVNEGIELHWPNNIDLIKEEY